MIRLGALLCLILVSTLAYGAEGVGGGHGVSGQSLPKGCTSALVTDARGVVSCSGGGGSSFTNLANVKSQFGAQGDTLSYSDAVMSADSNVIHSTSAIFTASDIGKVISLTGSGAAGVSQSGAIVSLIDAQTVVVSFTSVLATPYTTAQFAGPATAQSGAGSYAPGDLLTLVGGASVETAAVFEANATKVTSASVNNAGSGGTTGACTVVGTTGTANGRTGIFHVSGTVVGGQLTGPLSVDRPGDYSSNPTSLSGEPVTGCNLTGATITITMGVLRATLSNQGKYNAAIGNASFATTTNGSGTGAVLSVSMGQIGGIVTYGTDDSSAIADAVTFATTMATSTTPAVVYIPSGNYTVKAQTIPIISGVRVQIIGDGPYQSNIKIDPMYVGDVFSFQDSWLAGPQEGFNFNGPTVALTQDAVGSGIRDLGFTGDRTSTVQQNAIMFYDKTDFTLIQNVVGQYVNGYFIGAGILKDSTKAYIRESWFVNLRCFSCGRSSVPNIEIRADGGGAGDIRYDIIDIYAPYGPGFVIRATNSGGVSQVFGTALRVEGLEGNPAGIIGDLIQIGDPVMVGTVSQITLLETQMVDPYAGYSDLHLVSTDIDHQPVGVFVSGSYGGGVPYGKAVTIDNGRLVTLNVQGGLFSLDTMFNVGPLANTSGQITVYADGTEATTWTYNIDSSIQNQVRFMTPGRYGTPSTVNGTGTPWFALNTHDGSDTFGVAAGQGAVDLQTVRSAKTQVASGASSIVSGAFNTASGAQTTALGGSTNTASGTNGVIIGGQQAIDRGRWSNVCHASGRFASNGDAQRCVTELRCTSSTTADCTLTGDGAAAGSNNCINVPAGGAFSLSISLSAIDHNAPSNNLSWVLPNGLLVRPTTAATTVWTAGTPVTASNGTGSAVVIASAADTTNGCLSLTLTPPGGNVDKWNSVARVETIEIQ